MSLDFDDVGLLDNFSLAQIKTNEEISKFELDENLVGAERVLYLLQNGQEAQISSAILMLPEDFCNGPQSTTTSILNELPKLLEENLSIQMEACAAFTKLFEKHKSLTNLLSEHLLPMMIKGSNLKSSEIALHWTNCILEVIPRLTNAVIHEMILPFVFKKRELSQNIQSRISTCKLVSKVASVLDRKSLIQNILPVVATLCQDIEYDVRSAMATNLSAIVQCLDKETIQSTMLKEIEDLAKDEEPVVRYAVLDTLSEIVHCIDNDSIAKMVMPIFDCFIENTSLHQINILAQLSCAFGKMCYMLSNYCNDAAKDYYVSFYRKLCTIGLSENDRKTRVELMTNSNSSEENDILCRQYAAFNFPAMLKFIGNERFEADLSNSFHLLCRDPSPNVRMTIAASFHEVCLMLRPKANVVQNEFIFLLKDGGPSVFEIITKNIGSILQAQREFNGTQSKPRAELIEAVLNSLTTIMNGTSWRKKVEIITEMRSLHSCFSQEILYKKFFQELYSWLFKHDAIPVKQELCSTLSFLVHRLRNVDHRDTVINNFLRDFCQSSNFQNRITFIDLCRYVMRDFSSNFFKINFFKPLITYADDNVLNVKLQFALMLPKLKVLLKIPTDQALVEELERSIRKMLIYVRNCSVNEKIRHAIYECDRIQFTVEKSCYSKSFNPKAQSEDEKKEEQENQLAADWEIEKKYKKTKPTRKVSTTLPPNILSMRKISSETQDKRSRKTSTSKK